jgi:hypothetical protein
MSSYIRKLERLVAAEHQKLAGVQQTLVQKVAATLGNSDVARIPELQRTLGSDARAIGAVLRELGFRRRRVWSGDDYALTRWERNAPDSR